MADYSKLKSMGLPIVMAASQLVGGNAAAQVRQAAPQSRISTANAPSPGNLNPVIDRADQNGFQVKVGDFAVIKDGDVLNVTRYRPSPAPNDDNPGGGLSFTQQDGWRYTTNPKVGRGITTYILKEGSLPVDIATEAAASIRSALAAVDAVGKTGRDTGVKNIEQLRMFDPRAAMEFNEPDPTILSQPTPNNFQAQAGDWQILRSGSMILISNPTGMTGQNAAALNFDGSAWHLSYMDTGDFHTKLYNQGVANLPPEAMRFVRLALAAEDKINGKSPGHDELKNFAATPITTTPQAAPAQAAPPQVAPQPQAAAKPPAQQQIQGQPSAGSPTLVSRDSRNASLFHVRIGNSDVRGNKDGIAITDPRGYDGGPVGNVFFDRGEWNVSYYDKKQGGFIVYNPKDGPPPAAVTELIHKASDAMTTAGDARPGANQLHEFARSGIPAAVQPAQPLPSPIPARQLPAIPVGFDTGRNVVSVQPPGWNVEFPFDGKSVTATNASTGVQTTFEINQGKLAGAKSSDGSSWRPGGEVPEGMKAALSAAKEAETAVKAYTDRAGVSWTPPDLNTSKPQALARPATAFSKPTGMG